MHLVSRLTQRSLALLPLLAAASACAQLSIGVYAGQPGLTPNTSATVTHVCSASIPLNGNTTTKELGANTGDGCPPAQILVSKPNSTWMDSFGQLYISDGGNYTANTDTGDAATFTTPVLANSYTGVTPGPGYTGEIRVLYNGSNSALGAALVASYNSTAILNSPVPTGDVYNVIGGGEYTAIGQGGSVGYTAIFASAFVAADSPGNIAEEASNYVRLTFVSGTQQSSFLAAGSGSSASPSAGAAAKPGYSYVLVNSNTPGSGYFGDGGYVLLSKFNGPRGLAFDAAGNLYIADSGNNVVREVNISGASTDAMGNPTQLGYVTGVVGGAGAGCAEATTTSGSSTACTGVESGDAGPARSANLNAPRDLVFDSYGNLYIADYGTSSVGRVRVVYLGSQPPPGFYATSATSCTGLASTASTGTLATCRYIYTFAGGGSSTTSAPAASIKLSSAAGLGIDSSNNLYIADALANQIWQVAASTQNASIIAGGGSTSAQAACSTDGYGDGCVATSAVLSAPTGHISVASSGSIYFGDTGNNVVRILKPYAQGTTPQTISFPAPVSPVAYGAPSTTLSATSSSGLPVSFSVSGPGSLAGNVLSFTGIGTITITANQPGNAVYAAAPAVQQTISVTASVLTVTPTSASRIFGTANPAFGYNITGFVSPDTAANSVTGSPVITTTATPLSPAGSYPITPSIGTLSSSSSKGYGFAMAPGTLTVTGGAAQNITFLPLPNYPNNDTSIQLAAFATSGLPVSFSVTGNAVLSGSTLLITGTGAVTVTASQPGNASFAAAAPVSQSFSAQPTSFLVFNNMFYQSMPNISTAGLINSDVVYEDKIWPDPNGTTQADEETLPTRASFDALMANYTKPGPLVLDIELLGLTSQANETILQTICSWAQQDKPGRLVGFYGYNVFDNISATYLPLAEELAAQVTAFFPSAYTHNDEQQEATWLANTTAEVTAERALSPGKPIYPYIWPQYHAGTVDQNNNSIANEFLTSTYWSYELNHLYTMSDGVVIWSSSSATWDDTTGWWEATTAFIQSVP